MEQTLDPGTGDTKLKKKSAGESQKPTFRGLVNLKDRVIATITGPSENSDSEQNMEPRIRGHRGKSNIETSTRNRIDNSENGQLQQQQKIQRTTQNSIPIIAKTDVQKELNSIMDDRPPVPAKNHARPQVQHKLDNRRRGEFRNQNGLNQEERQEERQDQLEEMIMELEEELRRTRERAFQAEEEILKGRKIHDALVTQLEDLDPRHKEPHSDSGKPNQQNFHSLTELSRIYEQLNRDEAFKTILSELKASKRDADIHKSVSQKLRYDNVTLRKEHENMIREKEEGFSVKIAELQQQFKVSKEEVAKVQEQRDQVITDRDRIRQELFRVVQQVASQTSLDVYQFDDKHFQSEFISIRGNIKDWAHRAFSTGQFTSDRGLSGGIERELRSLTPHWESYMYSDDHRSALVQAFIWTHLMRKVFCGAWEWSRDVHPLRQFHDRYIGSSENQDKLQLYHKWRSDGARFAVPQGAEHEALESISAVLKDTTDTIQNYLEPWLTMGKAQSNGMLFKIVKEAVQLDIKMQRQRASFLVWGIADLIKQNHGLYDSSAMEVRYGKGAESKKDQFVELLIAPLLLKKGTSDGSNYNSTIVIEKAQVDIAVPKKFKGLLSIVK